ncbi:hypothetical protein C8Q75DRAFT_515804 [Abortiporus biennis]|nr:hypothetical protein C8Q75DRAFT_515804 [Abortiporus biennis]
MLNSFEKIIRSEYLINETTTCFISTLQLPLPSTGAKVTETDTIDSLCPTQNDYIVAVIPSAPNEGSVANMYPQYSLLFPLQNRSTSVPSCPCYSERDELKTVVKAQEEQREKDLASAAMQKKDMETRNKALKKENQKLLAQIRKYEEDLDRLKQDAEEQARRHNEEKEVMQNHIEQLQTDLHESTDSLAVGVEAALDHIKLRNAIHHTQEQLAIKLGLTTDSSLALMKFRSALGPGSDEDRREELVRLLRNSDLENSQSKLSNSESKELLKPAVLDLLAAKRPHIGHDRNSHQNEKASLNILQRFISL